MRTNAILFYHRGTLYIRIDSSPGVMPTWYEFDAVFMAGEGQWIRGEGGEELEREFQKIQPPQTLL